MAYRICAGLCTISRLRTAECKLSREPNDADVRALESKIRQAWEDYKNKNKEAFARIFTEDAIEVEEGAEGAHDLKATLAEMDDFNLKTYSVSNFHFRPISSDCNARPLRR